MNALCLPLPWYLPFFTLSLQFNLLCSFLFKAQTYTVLDIDKDVYLSLESAENSVYCLRKHFHSTWSIPGRSVPVSICCNRHHATIRRKTLHFLPAHYKNPSEINGKFWDAAPRRRRLHRLLLERACRPYSLDAPHTLRWVEWFFYTRQASFSASMWHNPCLREESALCWIKQALYPHVTC